MLTWWSFNSWGGIDYNSEAYHENDKTVQNAKGYLRYSGINQTRHNEKLQAAQVRGIIRG